MQKPLFDIVMIARNESKTLPKMAESLKDFIQRGGHWLIVDTGSTDGTPEMARSLGATIYEVGDRFRIKLSKKQVGEINKSFLVEGEEDIVKHGDSLFHFSNARNYASSLATQDVVFSPDADEAYTTLNIDKINDLILKGVELFEYDFVFAHNPDGSPAIEFKHSKAFNRKKMYWRGTVHEVLSGEAKIERVGRDVIFLEHWQNHETERGGYLKGLAYAVLYESAAESPDRASHYLGRELLYTGRLKSAIKELKRHVDMNAWQAERAQSMIYIGHAYKFLGDYEQAEEWYHRAMQTDPGRREPFFHLGEMFHELNDWQRSAIYFSSALEIPWHGGYFASDKTLYGERINLLQSVNYYYLGRIEDAKKELLEAYAKS